MGDWIEWQRETGTMHSVCFDNETPDIHDLLAMESTADACGFAERGIIPVPSESHPRKPIHAKRKSGGATTTTRRLKSKPPSLF